MTPRNVLRRWRDDIHHALDCWWSRCPPETAAHPTAAVVKVVLDVEETDDALIVMADLPGLKQGDCTVEATRRCLVIRGEKKRSAVQEDRACSTTECRDGAFARTLHLPCDIDPDKARATYENGVLQITLPKVARTTSTWVQISIQE